MAEGTRLKLLEQQMNSLQSRMESQDQKLGAMDQRMVQVETQLGKIDHHLTKLEVLDKILENQQRLDEMWKEKTRKEKEVMENQRAATLMGKGLLPNPYIEMESTEASNCGIRRDKEVMGTREGQFRVAGIQNGGPQAIAPKWEMHYFDGTNPRGWIRRCQKYFVLCQTPEQQKVEVAAIFLEDMVDVWYQGWIVNREELIWKEFVEAICERFGEKGMKDVVEEFNKLNQNGTVEEYQSKFEELKALMVSENPNLTESYFISSFLSGLNEELRPLVKVLRPKTLSQAIEQARLQELALEAMYKKQRSWAKGGMVSGSMKSWNSENGSKNYPSWNAGNGGRAIGNENFKSYVNPSTNRSWQNSTSNSATHSKRSSNMGEVKRQPGQCFKCGDKYFVGHICKRQLMNMEVEGEIEEIEDGEQDQENGEEEAEREHDNG